MNTGDSDVNNFLHQIQAESQRAKFAEQVNLIFLSSIILFIYRYKYYLIVVGTFASQYFYSNFIYYNFE